METFNVEEDFPVWLWPEREGMRLWTAQETHFFPSISLAIPAIELLRTARDGKHQVALASVFEPPALGRKLAEIFSEPNCHPVLHLAEKPSAAVVSTDSQAQSLHAIPFEWLSLNGHPVGEQVMVARHVLPDAVVALPAREKPIQLLDMWPKNTGEKHPLDSYFEASVLVTRGSMAASTVVRSTAPDNYAALVYFGHGSEDTSLDAPPLMDSKNKSPWVLPIDNGLPPLVILLACGTDCGNLINYGRELLEHGATTVIAPYGKLYAPESSAFLEVFLADWLEGVPVAKALRHAQRNDVSARGAKRLTIIGSPSLRRSDTLMLSERGDKALVDVCENCTNTDRLKAAAILANRQTLRSFIGTGKLIGAAPLLLSLLHPEADEERERWLFQLYDQVPEGYLHRLTRIWLYALQASCAERFDHSRIVHYERSREWEVEEAEYVPAHVHYYWSRVHYRSGRYVASLTEVERALALIPRGAASVEVAPLARHVVNIFVDINMPVAALAVADALKDYLDHDCEAALVGDASLGMESAGGWSVTRRQAEIRLENHYLLDSRARAQLRVGQALWKLAIQTLLDKRKSAVNEWGDDGLRELAGLLYVSAWGGDLQSVSAICLAREVTEILAKEDSVEKLSESKGNDALPYLLRALSVWAWRAKDSEAVALLSTNYLESFDTLPADPATLAFVVAYLKLYELDTQLPVLGLPDWSIYRSMLEKENYFLELAAFDALMGNTSDAQRMLQRHHRRLRDLPKILASLAITFGELGLWSVAREIGECWKAESESRFKLESALLVAGHGPSPEILVENGLFPL